MVVEHKDAALMVYLKAKSALYYGKVHELRNEIRNWLAYIPQTFPHYTRHTIEHSDAIILQISKLLFWDDNPTKPVVQLSGAEAYILIAAAYLHDAGMVTSDREKQEIIQSEAWREWTTGNGGGAKRWNDIEELRISRDISNESVKHFICDLQTRFLIAEYVRRTDFRRAAGLIEEHQQSLGRFAFDSIELRETIASVCVAHGLERHRLEDNEQYPELRDILDEKVNVRFLAILLRLGDLLDMSHDRACPLLLNAACPLPADSLAHWSQYRRIRHRLTSPDRIEIRAECESQDEHRVLQDWCQWIVDEAHFATAVMAHAARHAEWRPPLVGINDGTNTIVIRPSSKASYIWSEWKFELDHQAVFERLIHDVYDSPETFIRELVQNALDATRCQMYSELVAAGIEPPEHPTRVEEEIRSRYPVKISLREEKLANQLSGEDELRQVFRIEDCGIGMDKEIIQRYFLQVGRSYYTTEQFRRKFRFMPSSRF